MLNRSVVTLHARLPFVCWINALPKGGAVPLPLANRRLGAYLIPRVDAEMDSMLILVEHAQRIFEQELLNWWPAEYDWPPERDLVTLETWFEVSCHATVVDVGDGPRAAP